MQKTLLWMIPFLLLCFNVLAEETDVTAKSLVHGLAAAKCKTDYVSSLVDTILTHDSNATSLKTHKNTIIDDLEELQSLADSGKAEEFQNYVQKTFDVHLKEGRKKFKDLVQEQKKSLTKDDRASLKTDKEKVQQTFETCHLAALKAYANGRITAYKAILESHQQKVDVLDGKGINVTGLKELLQDAKKQVIEPLERAVGFANTSNEIRTAASKYCLFDNCKNGQNYHFAAKFATRKITAIIEALKTAKPESLAKLATAEAEITAANTLLDRIGTNEYGPGQHDDVWKRIKAAAKTVKEVAGA